MQAEQPNETQVKLLGGLDGIVWERGVFEVPAGTPEERVQAKASEFRNKFGNALEARGCTVLSLSGPERYTGPIPWAPDREKYVMYAQCRRKVVTVRINDVPDELVPKMRGVKGIKVL